MTFPIPTWRACLIAALVLSLSGCGMLGKAGARGMGKVRSMAFAPSTVDCMERAMFFESNRSSRDGLVAVGSVVMNRVASDQYPNTVCGVVAQKGQFAPGIMSKPMKASGLPQVQEAARAVLAGERHPMIGRAMFFHQEQARFSYDNMHYTVVAGGNAFYEKRKADLVTQSSPPRAIEGLTGG